MTGYVVRLTGRDYPLYVRTRETALSGYTRYLEDAKLFKTRAGAAGWLRDRAPFPGVVVEVDATVRRGRFMVEV